MIGDEKECENCIKQKKNMYIKISLQRFFFIIHEKQTFYLKKELFVDKDKDKDKKIILR